MQSVEKFMRQYFDELAAEVKREQDSRAPFRRKFFTENCPWRRRDGELELVRAEKVLTSSSSGETAEVITSLQRSPDRLHQFRYHLLASSDGWLISEVNIWCHRCQGEKGDKSCGLCQGTGWHQPRKRPKK